MEKSGRYEDLDNLRGAAAIIVILSHIGSTFFSENVAFRNNPLAFLAIHSPIHALWNGHSAVILFFVLSGFVLSQPWTRGKPPAYSRFVVRRICRIWIPFAGAVIFSSLLYVFVAPARPLGARRFLTLMSLVGYADTIGVNSSLWSLVHEMRISLIFPLIIWLCAGRTWKRIIAISFTVSAIALGARAWFAPHLNSDIFNTIHYATLFAVGAALAANIDSAISLTCKWPRATFALGITLFAYATLGDWPVAAGSVLLITSALRPGEFQRMLRSVSIRWAGTRSYTIYLYHLPILMALAHSGILPVAAIGMTVALTIAVSSVAYRLIEVPAIKLRRAPMAASRPA